MNHCECGREQPIVAYDSEAAKGLSVSTIRDRWPRVHHTCECGLRYVLYASFEHYVSGDW